MSPRRPPTKFFDFAGGRRLTTFLTTAALILFFISTPACTRPFVDGDAELQIASRDQADIPRFTMAGEFTRAFYRFQDQNTVTVVLVQGLEDAPARIAVLEMFWKARAGLTPIDRTATNTLVRFFEFRDTEAEPNTVGVYAGAGFMRLHDNPAVGQIDGSLRDADLRLTDRSENYTDRLGRAVLAGSFTATRNDAEVTAVLRELNQQLEERLGYPRLVQMPASHRLAPYRTNLYTHHFSDPLALSLDLSRSVR